MRWVLIVSVLFAAAMSSNARVIVFWRDGFPIVESQAVSRHTLATALTGAIFSNCENPADLANANPSDLLVMPYGSAFPLDAWPAVHGFLREGGSLLVLGGRPFRVPVSTSNGHTQVDPPEDAYLRELGIVHTYDAPQSGRSTFTWRDGYSFLPVIHLNAQKYFVLQGGVNGLAYMQNPEGESVASPVVVINHSAVESGSMLGSRWIFLDFQPQSGFWDSPDGTSLIRTAAGYARAGATLFSIESPSAVLRPGETAWATVHLRNTLSERRNAPLAGTVRVQLSSPDQVVETINIRCSGETVDTDVEFAHALSSGFYTVRATYLVAGKTREFADNAFWVADARQVGSGPALGVAGDFLTRDGHPFFPFGTNYFTTEENGWDFSEPRNAAVWEHDFAEMQKHNVSFVRTGVWGGQLKFLSPPEGGVSERFLRNLEGYLLCAQRHHIAVNFTFFAFDPQTTFRIGQAPPSASLPGSNPYLDPITIRAEEHYLLSIVDRFKNVPYLCWDLINEPSFSNPGHLWRGNTPNGDPAELHAWRDWLDGEYHDPDALASAWGIAADEFSTFDSVPLPTAADLTFNLEQGQAGQARAVDYNLFAQDMFARWVQIMVAAIRSTGSGQLIDVGQDEGGVENRVLNQFYAGAGLSFTTNHTYRQNSALLWDSLVAKVPGIPNIVGETGYQPVIYPNGDWRFDELAGASLIERKWAEGFAGATSGVLSWDWAREIYFGMKRSDGSSKIWEHTMREMGRFAAEAAPYATGLVMPDVAIILPQSLQLSVLNQLAIKARQNCVRALYGYARSQAYVVGEDQLGHLGDPKLILLPSPWILDQNAWQILLRKVQSGAILFVSGRFDQDPHFRPTDRAAALDIGYKPAKLFTRGNEVRWPAGSAHLIYGGALTDFLDRAVFPGNKTFVEKPLGRGKILLCALPLELNENLDAAGEIYKYALSTAGIKPVYVSTIKNAGLLICPTQFPHATLYVLTNEGDDPVASFIDERSQTQFAGSLAPGRAALLLVGEHGETLASYNWRSS